MDVTQSFSGLAEEVRDSFGEEIVSLRRDIHREPELGFDTEKTAEKVLDALDGLPLEIQTGVAENGVVATLKGEGDDGSTVALRADMDALPIHEETDLPFASETDGKMHACGHDGHTSMLVGAARALSQGHLRERLNGNVKFVFQPAEEGQAGGRAMVEEGVAEGVGSIFALHLWPGLAFECGNEGRPYNGRRRRLRDDGQGLGRARRHAPPDRRRRRHRSPGRDGSPDHRIQGGRPGRARGLDGRGDRGW